MSFSYLGSYFLCCFSYFHAMKPPLVKHNGKCAKHSGERVYLKLPRGKGNLLKYKQAHTKSCKQTLNRTHTHRQRHTLKCAHTCIHTSFLWFCSRGGEGKPHLSTFNTFRVNRLRWKRELKDEWKEGWEGKREEEGAWCGKKSQKIMEEREKGKKKPKL